MLARLVGKWTYNVILSYVHNHQDAEEVLQDTLIATINHIDQFEQQSSIKTWVYSIAINKARDHLKHKNRKKRSAVIVNIDLSGNSAYKGPIDNQHPGLQLENKESINQLFAAINSLPEKQKTALILAKLDKQPVKVIAEIMHTSPKAVESLIARAKANLRKRLAVIGNTT